MKKRKQTFYKTQLEANFLGNNAASSTEKASYCNKKNLLVKNCDPKLETDRNQNRNRNQNFTKEGTRTGTTIIITVPFHNTDGWLFISNEVTRSQSP